MASFSFFFSLFSAPLLTVVDFFMLGFTAVYFILGIQNLFIGRNEKNKIKIRSGYIMVSVSPILAVVFTAAWYYSGGKFLLTWLQVL
jgi:small-conductance mechanosensitive channel